MECADFQLWPSQHIPIQAFQGLVFFQRFKPLQFTVRASRVVFFCIGNFCLRILINSWGTAGILFAAGYAAKENCPKIIDRIEKRRTWSSHGGTCCSFQEQGEHPCQHCRRKRSESRRRSKSLHPWAWTSRRGRNTRDLQRLLKIIRSGLMWFRFLPQRPGNVRARPSRMNITK